MTLWMGISALLYVWAPFVMMEAGAQYEPRTRKHKWSVTPFVAIVLFLVWPIAMPLASYFKRKQDRRGPQI